MKISKEDFKDYNISSIIASETEIQKQLIVSVDNVVIDPDVYFEIYSKRILRLKTYSLDEAINYYNSI